MKTVDFNYNLPGRLIAQRPLGKRGDSRLLFINRSSNSLQHRQFNELPGLLNPGDHLIFNNTRVLPARLFCRKTTGANVELLFLHEIDDVTWRVMVNPGRRLKEGANLVLEDNSSISLIIKEIYSNGDRSVCLIPDKEHETILQVIESYGEIPLPPYIRRSAAPEDKETYQTVYAQKPGAVAAPTAGLHFTHDIINRLKNKGIKTSFLTLHVGAGTFAPVKEADPRRHEMHSEMYELLPDVIEKMVITKENGGRNIAVGTTVVRVLEHSATNGWPPVPGSGSTNLMILPPYDFKAVDGLMTNFHLPCSTLLMLVCAFGGRDTVMNTYEEAVQNSYRFYSYGDAMLIL